VQGTLKVYRGLPHGPRTPTFMNPELLGFIKG
jgi:hypothetical protein